MEYLFLFSCLALLTMLAFDINWKDTKMPIYTVEQLKHMKATPGEIRRYLHLSGLITALDVKLLYPSAYETDEIVSICRQIADAEKTLKALVDDLYETQLALAAH